MTAPRWPVVAIALLAIAPILHVYGYVSSDELSLLQDSDGWEYTKVATGNGFPTEHVCFDGAPHPEECRGTLTLSTDEKFVKKVYIRGQADTRSGRYKIDGSDITFFDESDVQDGPYRMTIDGQAKTLSLELGGERIELMLEKEYRSKRKSQNKDGPPKS